MKMAGYVFVIFSLVFICGMIVYGIVTDAAFRAFAIASFIVIAVLACFTFGIHLITIGG